MECYASPRKLFGPFLAACLMVGGSYYCASLPGIDARVVGWFGVAFFGLCFVGDLSMALRPGPKVVIGDAGIEDRRHKLGVISWGDIDSLSIHTVQSTSFLGIEVFDPEKFLARMTPWQPALVGPNRALGFPTLAIGFAGLSPGIDEVWRYIQERYGFEVDVPGPQP